jgi:hypothetical protein
MLLPPLPLVGAGAGTGAEQVVAGWGRFDVDDVDVDVDVDAAEVSRADMVGGFPSRSDLSSIWAACYSIRGIAACLRVVQGIGCLCLL